MDFVQVILIVGAVAGFILVVVSFAQKKEAEIPVQPPLPLIQTVGHERNRILNEKLEAMDTTISEADSVIAELGGISKNVFKEIDQKYNELLFLYDLIDKKSGSMTGGEPPAVMPAAIPEFPPVSAGKARVLNDPRFTQITELRNSGMSVSQIAKELGMGQGEVSLIMAITGK